MKKKKDEDDKKKQKNTKNDNQQKIKIKKSISSSLKTEFFPLDFDDYTNQHQNTLTTKNQKNDFVVTTNNLKLVFAQESYNKQNQNENNNINCNSEINVFDDYVGNNSLDEKNLDEDYSNNSDQEIDKKIHEIREKENEDERLETDETIISGVIPGITTEESKKKCPDNFQAPCVLFGENKENYDAKIIINSSFILMFLAERKNVFKNYDMNFYSFPLLSIKNYIVTKKSSHCLIDIILKDYRSFSFKISKTDYQTFNQIIKEFGIPNKNILYFTHAYYYYDIYKKKYINDDNDNFIDGWKIYDPDDEFRYQDLDFENTFRIIDNSKFDYCSSYPKKIVVPISMTNDDIKKCATYRTKERFPALTYRYQKNGKCIWRSSQTKSGIKGKTNKDVLLLTKIAESSKKLYVYDARPLLNAWANKLKGAGYEDTSAYPDIKMELTFCGIPNIHAVRSACHKIYSTMCFNGNNDNEDKTKTKTKTKTNLENNLWYDSIITIIKGAMNIAETIKNDNTVLIHCSDGWDRTSQLSATSQLILDKRFRTLDGFICLIEKDWLSFGHQFRYRCGMYSPNDSPSNVSSENQKSPIFIQWLDAVYQIMIQNITKFEFNTDLLFFLANEMFTGTYGTFLFNNDMEREKYNAKSETISIWSYVKENEYLFLNQAYVENDNTQFVINYKRINLWTKYFYRFEEGDNNYIEIVGKKNKVISENIEKNKRIISDLIKVITKNCKEVDLSGLCSDTKNLLLKYDKKIKFK